MCSLYKDLFNKLLIFFAKRIVNYKLIQKFASNWASKFETHRNSLPFLFLHLLPTGNPAVGLARNHNATRMGTARPELEKDLVQHQEEPGPKPENPLVGIGISLAIYRRTVKLNGKYCLCALVSIYEGSKSYMVKLAHLLQVFGAQVICTKSGRKPEPRSTQA